jgi:hypothetical protein
MPTPLIGSVKIEAVAGQPEAVFAPDQRDAGQGSPLTVQLP